MTNACPTGKVRFPTPQAAWRCVVNRNRRPDAGPRGAAYQCPRCQGYHTTRARDSKLARQPWELSL